jgi:hypothetical protein
MSSIREHRIRGKIKSMIKGVIQAWWLSALSSSMQVFMWTELALGQLSCDTASTMI